MFSFVERKSLKLAMIMAAVLVMLSGATPTFASEAELVLPDLASVSFFGMTGWTILFLGIFATMGLSHRVINVLFSILGAM